MLLPLPGDGQQSVGASGCEVCLVGQAHAKLEAPAAPRPPCVLSLLGLEAGGTRRGRPRAPAARWGGARARGVEGGEWGWEGREEMGKRSGLRESVGGRTGGTQRHRLAGSKRCSTQATPPSLAAGSQPRTPPPVLPMGPATETAQGQEPAGLRSGHRLQEFPDFCARGSASPDIILWKCAQPLPPRLTGENDQIDVRASSFSFPTDSQKAGIFVPVIQG